MYGEGGKWIGESLRRAYNLLLKVSAEHDLFLEPRPGAKVCVNSALKSFERLYSTRKDTVRLF